MNNFIFVTIVLSSLMFAQVKTQSDWLGGPGVSGQLIDFQNEFMSSSMIDYLKEPGRITLLPVDTNNLENSVYSSIYPDSGFLESSIVDSELSLTPWAYLYFSSIQPQSTSIGIQIRASDDYNDMGPWSEIFMQPGYLQGVLDESANYLQYRAVLYTENPDTTPALKDVSICYSMGATEGSCLSVSPASSFIAANPFSGPLEVVVTLAAPSSVEICVFDLSGRLAAESCTIYCGAGRQTVMVGEFKTGIYNVFLHSVEFSSCHRFSIVR